MAGAGLRGILASILRKIAPKKTQIRFSTSKEKNADSGVFADTINEDKLNRVEKKVEVKGKKKFLEDLRIYTMFQMISLFWSRKVVGVFIKKMPSPVEYGSSPTVMKRTSHDKVVRKMSHQVVRDGKPSYTYNLTKKQIRNVVKKEITQKPVEYRTFKGNKYLGKVNNPYIARQGQRQAFKELMAKRQMENVYTR